MTEATEFQVGDVVRIKGGAFTRPEHAAGDEFIVEYVDADGRVFLEGWCYIADEHTLELLSRPSITAQPDAASSRREELAERLFVAAWGSGDVALDHRRDSDERRREIAIGIARTVLIAADAFLAAAEGDQE